MIEEGGIRLMGFEMDDLLPWGEDRPFHLAGSEFHAEYGGFG